jgi:hypothetical protein
LGCAMGGWTDPPLWGLYLAGGALAAAAAPPPWPGMVGSGLRRALGARADARLDLRPCGRIWSAASLPPLIPGGGRSPHRDVNG